MGLVAYCRIVFVDRYLFVRSKWCGQLVSQQNGHIPSPFAGKCNFDLQALADLGKTALFLFVCGNRLEYRKSSQGRTGVPRIFCIWKLRFACLV